MTHRQVASGELELTFMNAFCRGANLRALLAMQNLPEVLERFRDLSQQFFPLNNHVSDLLALAAQEEPATAIWTASHRIESLSADIYDLLLHHLNHDSPSMYQSGRNYSTEGIRLSSEVQYRDVLEAGGVRFTTDKWKRKRDKGDSFIRFRLPHIGRPKAGQIESIFVHARSSGAQKVFEHFLVVKPFEELEPIQIPYDPYLQFPFLDIQLHRNAFATERFVIKTTDIISHIATCPFESEELDGSYLVTLSLDRVSGCTLMNDIQLNV
jgi:hypothetical protein